MASVSTTAPPRSPIRVIAAVPHVVMIAVMTVTMTGGHSLARSWAGAAVLLLVSFAYAKPARTSASARDHLLDLWVTALVLIAGHVSAGDGHHGGSIGGGALVAGIVIAWLFARVLVTRRVTTYRLATGAACATGLALMLATG